MKKLLIIALLTFLVTPFLVFSNQVIADDIIANGVPYKTYTMGVNRRLVETDTAYVPVGILNHSYLLNSPSDIHHRGEYIFVANTGGKNVVVFTTQGQFVKTIGFGTLVQPTGVFVDENFMIYVADKSLNAVLVFDMDNRHMMTYSRPTEPLFGDETSPYTPEKVVVDKGGNIFISGEGSVNGIIQMNRSGQFRGYFGVNQTRFDWRMTFSDVFLSITDELAKNLPPAPSNIAIDDKGLVYTITSNLSNGIKKFNMKSVVILTAEYTSEDKLIDLDIDKFDNIFVLDDIGQIHQYDQYGRLLFRFGGIDVGNQILGLFSQPTSVTIDDLGNLYVADKGYNNIQIFYPTQFVTSINESNYLYFQGKLEESKAIWEELHRMNSTFSVSNSALGDIYMKEGQYSQALESYQLSKNRSGYSEAYWEIRNAWLMANAGIVLYSFIGLVVLNISLSISGIKRKLKRFIKPKIETLKSQSWYRPIKTLGLMLKKPADTLYMIKHKNIVTTQSAHVLYLLLFVIMILSYYITSFLFNSVEVNQLNLGLEFIKVVGILLLWVISNYLISTLADGEGWFKDIYRGTIYSLAPIFFILIPLSIISNLLSYNEMFIFTFIRFIMYAWSAILILITVKEMHNYSFFETLKNILLTLFTMVIIALLGFIIYLLFNQLLEFIISLIKEVVIRVQH